MVGSAPVCGHCAHFRPERPSMPYGPCMRSRAKRDGVVTYAEVRAQDLTGSMPWCPYGRSRDGKR